MTDEDFILALQLQEEYDQEKNAYIPDDIPSQSTSSAVGPSKSTLSLADDSWELIDPNPEIRSLFMQYNDRFFWGRLAGVEVRWSPRMTLCAGLCVYEGRGGLCSVRLSLPLLKLRPRKDLVQTLLHEMIHAYLFVTDNNKDHDGHGPEFHKHMYRINKEAGVNITVYHTFHDEVAAYQTHWWRCNGPCQQRKPYFGYVKRAMNRAPGPNDPWWRDHQNSCNGVFIKVKEPEDYGKKKKKTDSNIDVRKKTKKNESESPSKNKNMDIRVFVGKGNILGKAITVNAKECTTRNQEEKDNKKDSKGQMTFYSSDSDDCIPIDTGSHSASKDSQKDKRNTLDKYFTHRSNTNVESKKDATFLTECDENKQTDLSDSFLVLSDSDEELMKEVDEIFKANRDLEYKDVSNANNESKSAAEGEKSTFVHNSNTKVKMLDRIGEDNCSDVQLKLRSVWADRFKTSDRALSRIDINRKIDSDNTKLTVKSNTGTKRVSDDILQNSDRKRRKPDSTYVGFNRTANIQEPSCSVKTEESSSNSDQRLPVSSTPIDMCICPVCSQTVPTNVINTHLDQCLGVT